LYEFDSHLYSHQISQPAITKGRIFKEKFSIFLKDSYTQSAGEPLFILERQS